MDATPLNTPPLDPGKIRRSRRILPRLQFRLRTLLLLTLVLALWLGLWLKPRVDEARATKVVVSLGGHVYYDYQVREDCWIDNQAEHPAPAWLRSIIGDSFGARVTFVQLRVPLDQTRLEQVWPVLGHFSRLEHVDLARVRAVDDEALDRLADAVPSNLKSLRLWHTAISDDGLKHLRFLDSLKLLDVSGTQVSDEGLLHLQGLKSLTSLGLCETRVTDDGLMHLKNLKNLRAVYVRDTEVSEAGRQAFQSVMPNRVNFCPDLL